MLTVLIIFIALALFYFYLNNRLNYWTRRGVKQKTTLGKFVDNWKPVLRWDQTVTGMVEYFYKQFPNERYSGFYQFNKPILLLRDPELIREILVKDYKFFPDHTSFENKKNDENLWTTTLFALKGEKWKKMRSIQDSIYTSNKLKNMFVGIEESAKDFVENIKHSPEKRINKFNCFELTRKLSVDVVVATVFGLRLNSTKNTNNDVYLKMKTASNFTGFWISLKFFIFFTLPAVFKWLNLKIFDDDITEYFKNLSSHIMNERIENRNEFRDALGLLMKIQNKRLTVEDIDVVTNREIANSVLGMIITGVSSLSNILCFLFYELAVNENVQDKLRNEILETSKKYPEGITYENLSEMKYMEMVLQEILRKWPTGVITDRVSLDSYEIPSAIPNEKNVQLTKDAVLWIPIFAIHRDPLYFPEPEKFSPDRFSEENKRNIRPYTYLPFGAGPRTCIGMRFAKLAMKVLLYNILKDLEVHVVAETQVPIKTSWSSFTCSPGGTVWLGMRKIDEKKMN